MKEIKILVAILFITLVSCDFNITTMDEEIWDLEVELWKYAENMDIENYMGMLHEKFTDWPANYEKPFAGKEAMLDYVSSKIMGVKRMSIDIEHQLTQTVSPDEVIVFFNCTMSIEFTDASSVISSSRMMHVWKRSEGDFKLLSGFQAIK